ncbi:MAG: permease [Eubacteriaceae bacterium]
MDFFTIALWIITIFWFISSIIKDKKRTLISIKMSVGMMKGIASDIIAILLLIGLILTFIPPETMGDFLTSSNNLSSTVIFALVGSITLIPAFVAFPLAGSLLQVGANVMPIVAFITTLTMVGIVTFPLEKREFGTRFSVIRNALSFIFAIGIAVIMGGIL